MPLRWSLNNLWNLVEPLLPVPGPKPPRAITQSFQCIGRAALGKVPREAPGGWPSFAGCGKRSRDFGFIHVLAELTLDKPTGYPIAQTSRSST